MSDNKTQKKKGWKYRIDLGPVSIILWGIFILFFMAWIFILGIFVGRGFVPGKITDISEIKGEITKLKNPIEADVSPDTYSAPSDDSKETEPELAFYDRLTSKKDEAKYIRKTEANETKRTVPPASGLTEIQDSSSDNLRPSGDSAVKSGSGRYTIQVASIAELANAEKTVKQLLEKGYDAYYYETIIKGKKYYRIRCGKFSDRAEAQVYLLRLEEKTGLKGYVTDAE